MAIGAVEEFLDLQLQDAMDEVARVEKVLENAGVPKESMQESLRIRIMANLFIMNIKTLYRSSHTS